MIRTGRSGRLRRRQYKAPCSLPESKKQRATNRAFISLSFSSVECELLESMAIMAPGRGTAKVKSFAREIASRVERETVARQRFPAP
jgi:hypothetical protein